MAGERCLVIDLQNCTSMDSTFMGTLAGLASRVSSPTHPGTIQIADISERNRDSLEDLGIDFLLDINPENAVWQDKLVEIRSKLSIPKPIPTQNLLQKTEHVFEAHQELSQANEKNEKTFKNVIELLESELESKRKPSDSPTED